MMTTRKVNPVPKGFHTVTPYLIVRGAADAIEFYQKTFGAEERSRVLSPDGTSIVHAELKIGNSIVLLADEAPAMGIPSPPSIERYPGYAAYLREKCRYIMAAGR